MKRWERSIVPGGLILAGLVFLFAAVKPAFSGRALDVTLLLVGVVAGLAGLALWRKAAVSSDR